MPVGQGRGCKDGFSQGRGCIAAFLKYPFNSFLYSSMLLAGTYTGVDLSTPSNAPFLNLGGVLPSKVIEVRPEHPSKARLSITLTEFGIVIEVRPEHPWKANALINFTELGIVNEVRPLQPQKA